ncbi:hypothetical protein BDW59DRAFT_166821 [Aspergillus cavernicola]|uniref:Nephrocystin 3-like N-terminal domain-containing protein n=1 Tax=Aspergillus cavernicola TaxID=176166 RepID=A0ABR4HJB6_9EURO
MDPLSAIGLASSILQFIEFGVNLCQGFSEVASSTTGLTDGNTHISIVVEDLKQATDGLSVKIHGDSKQERELVQLAGNCQEVSLELAEILSKLRVKRGDRVWSSVRVAWKSTLKQKKIASIEKRLADYRAQIVLRLNLLLYKEQSPIKDYLERIEQQAIDIGNRHGKQIQTQHGHSVIAESAQIQCRSIPGENEILRALHFPTMFYRDDTIDPAVGGTYRWLVQNSPDFSVVSESQTEADANHIGNEGAKGLQTISDKELIFVSVFFWSAGNRLQRSLEGLYRSILYQTLRECPEMLYKVFDHPTGIASWEGIRLPLLKEAMDKLTRALDPRRYKLCVAVDGHDEYEGDSFDQADLVKSIQAWGCHANIKNICSARPHLEYMRAFTDQERMVALHELTKGDILGYTITTLRSSAGPCMTTRKSLNALSFSWLQDLNDPRFPFQDAVCCYSDTEIERRLEPVRNQIRDLTRGMLEIRQGRRKFWDLNSECENHPFFRDSVEFFHRTFRGYILARWSDKPAPGFETYLRIALAELKFSCVMRFFGKTDLDNDYHSFYHMNILSTIFSWLDWKEIVLPFRYFEEIESILNGYEQLLNSTHKQQNELGTHGVIIPVFDGFLKARPEHISPFSPLKLLAWQVPVTSQCLMQRIAECPELEQSHIPLAEVFMACSILGERDVASLCLEKGLTLNSEVAVLQDSNPMQRSVTVSVWAIILGLLTMYDQAGYNTYSRVVGPTIEYLLEVGADSSVLFLICPMERLQDAGGSDDRLTRYIDLGQLLEIVQPANIESLRRLLHRPVNPRRKWWNGVADRLWSITSTPELDHTEEVRRRYKQASPSEICGEPDILLHVSEVVTRAHRLPRKFAIQMW